MCDDRGFATGWELMTASRRFHHRLEVFMDESLEHVGMTFAQYRLLELVHSSRETHVSDLARQLRVSRQGARKIVARLRDGFLVDTTEENGRVYVAAAETAGKRIERCRAMTAELKEQLEQALTPGERDRVVTLLDRAADALRSPEPPPRPEWWLAP
jgi:DNA-binding MarR family transcriptional regulator